nr:MAG TPA: hypothetical protein [Caudoviricetes sp.]
MINKSLSYRWSIKGFGIPLTTAEGIRKTALRLWQREQTREGVYIQTHIGLVSTSSSRKNKKRPFNNKSSTWQK